MAKKSGPNKNISLTARLEGDPFKGVSIEALWLGKAWGAYEDNERVVRDLMLTEGQTMMQKLKFVPPVRTTDPYAPFGFDEEFYNWTKKMQRWEGGEADHYGEIRPRSGRYGEGFQMSFVTNVGLGRRERALSGIQVVNEAKDEDGEEFVEFVGGNIFVYDEPGENIVFGAADTGQYFFHQEQGWPTIAIVLTDHFATMTNLWYDRMKSIIESSGRKVKNPPQNFGYIDL